jgi:hypothetical protein
MTGECEILQRQTESMKRRLKVLEGMANNSSGEKEDELQTIKVQLEEIEKEVSPN